MLSRFPRLIATVLSVIIGLAGIGAILFAWHLPPFSSSVQTTDDAYVTGKVTYLAPQISGNVTEVDVTDYERVKAGQVLMKIDDRSYKESLAEAKASLDSAQASLDAYDQDRRSAEASVKSAKAGVDSAQASLDQAQIDLTRAQKLRDRGVNSNEDLEDAKLSYAEAKANLEQAKASAETAEQDLQSVIVSRRSEVASVEKAKAAYNIAQLDLDYTVIRAPVDGRLGTVKAFEGHYVSAGTNALSIVPDTIWVVANFKETQLDGMKIGQEVTFSVDALGHAKLKGQIERFSPATGSEFSVLGTSNATGNFIKISHRLPVRILISPDQPLANKLAPGMSVVARVDTASEPKPLTATLTPKSVPDDGK